jgi:predicted O-linked N-acetylglucosamine transferase (SPINDLY family)
VLPVDLAGARQAIAGLELDALIYGDIGMEPLTYYLAFARLAPVQAHLQGHPVTPGIPNLDYFLTSALQEPADCADHYRETPVPFAGTLFCYEPVPTVPPATRAEFGLPAQGALYVCPQTLFKFHPDFDAVLRTILEADPDGWLVLLEDRLPARTRQLTDRLAASLGGRRDRVLWVPRMAKQRYFQLIGLAAAVLDTTCFSGANTTLQALGLGVPVVTLPGEFVRGRMTLGWLREGGLMEMCATDAADYARIAARLGRDPVWRQALVDRIRAAAPLLFDRHEVVAEIQDFLTRAVDAAAEGRPRITWDNRDG